MKPVDTTGAGDAFVGGILHSLAANLNLYKVKHSCSSLNNGTQCPNLFHCFLQLLVFYIYVSYRVSKTKDESEVMIITLECII